MEKPTGRHRKPVRGWVRQVRWLFGAVLAALLRSSVEIRRQERRPRPSPRTGALELEPERPVSRCRSAGADVDRTRLGSIPNVAPQGMSMSGPVRTPRPRRPHPSEQGWCVDDDGVRGVRRTCFPARAELLVNGSE